MNCLWGKLHIPHWEDVLSVFLKNYIKTVISVVVILVVNCFSPFWYNVTQEVCIHLQYLLYLDLQGHCGSRAYPENIGHTMDWKPMDLSQHTLHTHSHNNKINNRVEHITHTKVEAYVNRGKPCWCNPSSESNQRHWISEAAMLCAVSK